MLPAREALLQHPRVVNLHRARGPEDFELRVEAEKCLQQVLLGPEPEVVQHGVARIVGRKKDIVNVDQNSGLEPGEDFASTRATRRFPQRLRGWSR
jgi:hypothetical protein